MSASDAAPLPRLGEVFFDVRGSSRSMRLSWYADTGVAVFSIWQGGMCTGTFRLPIGDLSRMIDILERGPHGAADYAEPAYDGDYDTEYAGGHPAGEDAAGHYGPRDAGAGDYGAGDYGRGEPRRGEYGHGEYRSGQYDQGDYRPGDYQPGDYRQPDYRAAEHGPADHGPADHGPAQYGPAGRGSRADDQGTSGRGPGDYGPAGYGPPDYGPPDYGPTEYEQAGRTSRRARRPDDGQYQADATGQHSVPGDESGYGQQRFVPPYVRAHPDSSQPSYSDGSEYRLPADPGAGARHSAGRHSSGQEP
jgi:hypothetical protein